MDATDEDGSMKAVSVRDPRDKGPSQCTHISELKQIMVDRNGHLRNEQKAKELAAQGNSGGRMHGMYK